VGNAGILVPPADPEALVKTIMELLDNPGRAEKLGRAGFKRVHNLFTWEKAAERTIEAYMEAIYGHS
jgi:glycosyltransferase involved in cell wall biosynthesis